MRFKFTRLAESFGTSRRIAIKIGCVTLVPGWGDGIVGKFLALDCAKGRGIILPGGKFEPKIDRTYRNAAARECREETGCEPTDLSYLWHGPDGGKFTTFAFTGKLFAPRPMVETREGKPLWATRSQLLASDYAAFYDVMFEMYDRGRSK